MKSRIQLFKWDCRDSSLKSRSGWWIKTLSLLVGFLSGARDARRVDVVKMLVLYSLNTNICMRPFNFYTFHATDVWHHIWRMYLCANVYFPWPRPNRGIGSKIILFWYINGFYQKSSAWIWVLSSSLKPFLWIWCNVILIFHWVLYFLDEWIFFRDFLLNEKLPCFDTNAWSRRYGQFYGITFILL